MNWNFFETKIRAKITLRTEKCLKCTIYWIKRAENIKKYYKRQGNTVAYKSSVILRSVLTENSTTTGKFAHSDVMCGIACKRNDEGFSNMM